MTEQERRTIDQYNTARMRALLTEDQRMPLADLERFGWKLTFVRRPMFQPSIPVVSDATGKTYAALEADGTLNEEPGFNVRV